MKKYILLLLLLSFVICKLSIAQNVGVGTLTPQPTALLDVSSTTKGFLAPRMLQSQRDVIPSPAAGLLIYQTDNTAGYYFYNGSAWVQLSTGAATNYWSLNGSNVYNNNSANVGIGTSVPADKFTVKTPSGNFGLSHTDGTVTVGTYISSTVGWLGTKSNHPLSFYTNNSGQQMTLITNGNFGIGTTVPDYRLTVSSNLIASNTNTNLLKLTGQNPVMVFSSGATDYGYLKAWTYQPYAPFTNGLVIGSSPGYPIFFSTNNYTASMEVADNGNVGIGVTNPANKLQIGSMGAAGFSGNNFALGNGNEALGIYQSDIATTIASSTDIILKPRNNGHGRIGINTSSPVAALDVNDYTPTSMYTVYDYLNNNSYDNGILACYNCTANVSIRAQSAVAAAEFDAYSDGRIKNIAGTSNTSKDLETINALRIADYTMKDKAKYGNKSFKKVIAQEVEEVYPQVVSKHADFIPNVYQVTSKVEKTANGCLLSFSGKHNISKGAKKLQVLLAEGEGMQPFDIVSLPSEYQVIIKATHLKINKAFVYGEEVEDFRTVDYEGLTTLDISATQELSKLIKKQQAAIDAQNVKIAELAEEIKNLQKEPNAEANITSNRFTVHTELQEKLAK